MKRENRLVSMSFHWSLQINNMKSPTILIARAIVGGGFFLASTVMYAATLTIACDSDETSQLCKEGAEAWASRTGNTVKIMRLPPQSDRLGIYQQFLAEKSSVVDVYTIDIVWAGVLGNYLVDLSKSAGGAVAAHFPAIIKNNTINGKLIAMPWFADAGLLYYRKDLLKKYNEGVPETWEELASTAKRVQDAERTTNGNKEMWGYVWQGKSYEGLTCNAVEWLASYNAGSVVEPSGEISINNQNAADALRKARSWIGTISPRNVLSFDEEGARSVFQSGNAVFMRNWPYAWGLANKEGSPIRNQVGVAALPKGGADGRPTATLGGQQLAVSKYSKNIELAIDLVMYLAGKEEQKRRAIVGGFNPTIISLYGDSEMIASNPFQGKLYENFINASARPSSTTRGKYNQVSSEFWNTVYSVLTGKQDERAALKELDAKLKKVGGNGKW
jgi:trehalose/maltose transport system substrate-binding protein